jgi:predicted nucleotidyltransferase
LTIPDTVLSDLCRRHGVRRLAFFGSVLTPDFRADSDVDVLVEFEAGHRVGLLGMARLERELTDLFGRAVDLRTPAELSRYFRDEVLRTADVCYAQG